MPVVSVTEVESAIEAEPAPPAEVLFNVSAKVLVSAALEVNHAVKAVAAAVIPKNVLAAVNLLLFSSVGFNLYSFLASAYKLP